MRVSGWSSAIVESGERADQRDQRTCGKDAQPGEVRRDRVVTEQTPDRGGLARQAGVVQPDLASDRHCGEYGEPAKQRRLTV